MASIVVGDRECSFPNVMSKSSTLLAAFMLVGSSWAEPAVVTVTEANFDSLSQPTAQGGSFFVEFYGSRTARGPAQQHGIGRSRERL
jgi:hypothetical protein